MTKALSGCRAGRGGDHDVALGGGTPGDHPGWNSSRPSPCLPFTARWTSGPCRKLPGRRATGCSMPGSDKITFVGKRAREVWVDADSRQLRRPRAHFRGCRPANRPRSTRTSPLGKSRGRCGAHPAHAGPHGSPRRESARSSSARRPMANAFWCAMSPMCKAPCGRARSGCFRDGDPMILLDIQRAETADTLESMQATIDYVEDLRAGLPPNVSAELFDVRAQIVDQRIATLSSNALMGMVIIVLVLLFFLNTRVALWVAAGIPVALLSTFVLMWATGQTINGDFVAGPDPGAGYPSSMTRSSWASMPSPCTSRASRRWRRPRGRPCACWCRSSAATTTNPGPHSCPSSWISGVVGPDHHGDSAGRGGGSGGGFDRELHRSCRRIWRHALAAPGPAALEAHELVDASLRRGLERGVDRFRNGPVPACRAPLRCIGAIRPWLWPSAV